MNFFLIPLSIRLSVPAVSLNFSKCTVQSPTYRSKPLLGKTRPQHLASGLAWEYQKVLFQETWWTVNLARSVSCSYSIVSVEGIPSWLHRSLHHRALTASCRHPRQSRLVPRSVSPVIHHRQQQESKHGAGCHNHVQLSYRWLQATESRFEALKVLPSNPRDANKAQVREQFYIRPPLKH